MNFTGEIGEDLVASYMTNMGYEVEFAPKRAFYDWDLKCSKDDSLITIEVKYDSKAYMWAKRRKTPDYPNLYIEFENTNQNKPSGIKASIADFYFYILKKGENNICYIFDRKELLSCLEDNDFKIVGNSSSGDNNALGWIPPLHELIADDKSGYRGTMEL